MTPQYATSDMAPALRALWDVCFPGEGETYCNLYFGTYYDPQHCCVIPDVSGRPISALFWFDGKLRTIRGVLPVVLLYAGCTAPAYRKQGGFFAAISFVAEHCRKNGIYAMLACLPPELHPVCGPAGLLPKFYLQETTYQPSSAYTALSFSSCSLKLFSDLRKAFVDRIPNSVFWEGHELSYMCADIWDSGVILQTEMYGQQYYVVVSKKTDHLLIRETNLPLQHMQLLVNGVCHALSHKGLVRIQTRDGLIPHGTPFRDTKRVYCAHSKTVLSHPALTHLAALDVPRPYLNLTADRRRS